MLWMLESFIFFQSFFNFIQSKPCSDILWKDESFIALNTKESLPSQCIQNKVFFNSTGHKFCISGSSNAKASELECKSGPSSKFRLPGYILPVRYVIRIEPDLSTLTTKGTTLIDIIVKSPTKKIVLHANAKALNIDKTKVTLVRIRKDGQVIPLNIRYHLVDAEKDFYSMMLDDVLQPNEISGDVYRLSFKFQGTIFPKPLDYSLFISNYGADNILMATHFE